MPSSILAEVSRSDLIRLQTSSTPSTNAKITGLEDFASYNWLDSPNPTILVPGSPPLWSQPPVPPKLVPDSGMVHIDQNAARNPAYPLEPLFRALLALRADFELKDIDLVTDRNNLRKLLRFVTGSSNDGFQFRVEVVDSKTALFTRLERETKRLIQGFRGYGHNFEKAYTKDPEESTGHHRIVGYRFGGMRCIVRYETDGYIGSESRSAIRADFEDATGSLLNMLQKVSISETKDEAAEGAGIKVISGGRRVDQSSIIEIKTRAISRTLDMTDVMPQLWISQTPTLVVGYHNRGRFDKVEIRKMKQDIVTWEEANQWTLQKLAILIKKIIEVVRSSDRSKGLVTYDGDVTLRIVTDEEKQSLPDHLYAMLKLKKEGGVSGSAEVESKGNIQPGPSPKSPSEGGSGMGSK